MMLFRNALEHDLNDIYNLAKSSGIGITTLPRNKKFLAKRLQNSCESLEKPIQTPKEEYYLFVMEDTEKGKVVGTAAIEAATGASVPFYSYKLFKQTHFCQSLKIRKDYDILMLVNDYQGLTEICTLYLEATYRKNNIGILLSRGRFLFMAQFRERFSSTVFAEMRGISNESGCSPFWESLGNTFFQMDFAEADRLTMSTNKQFIADLMPRYPIYVDLLTKEAQAVIGQPHASSRSALKILLREGFKYNHYVDIFDAGPTVETPLEQIKTIHQSRLYTVSKISDAVESQPFLIATTEFPFRAVLESALLNQENECILGKSTATLLQVEPGERVRIVPFHS